ncbi:MAG: hypothetical protein PVH40_10130 [Gemmatimonadales bacterium]
MAELCASAADLTECYRKHLSPLVAVHTLYVSPDASSTSVGDVIVAAVPGRGLTAYYRPEGSAQATQFTPDIYLQDWGYGPPYFHQTFSDSHDGWYRLPPDPWSTPVWLDASAVDGLSELRLRSGDIVQVGVESFYVLRTTGRSLVLRPEQDADMWCEAGDPPPLDPAEPRVYEWNDLIDDRGHLVVRPKYMKGC